MNSTFINLLYLQVKSFFAPSQRQVSAVTLQENDGYKSAVYVFAAFLALIFFLGPNEVLAQSTDLKSAMTNWTSTVKEIVSFVANVAVLVGVLAIAYGAKLIVDKSNDRENVKNGHIVVSFVGGAFLCLLWFIVQMMASTVGEGTIGQGWS